MPRKGRLSKADRVRESGEAFHGARRAHAAGGSGINSLEHRGLDRVGGHGKEGFARAVALAVPAANVHRLGLMLRERERPVLPAAAGPAPACPRVGGGPDVHYMFPPPAVPSKPRAAPRGARPGSGEAGTRRIRPCHRKNTGFSGRHQLPGIGCTSANRETPLCRSWRSPIRLVKSERQRQRGFVPKSQADKGAKVSNIDAESRVSARVHGRGPCAVNMETGGGNVK